MPERKAPAGVIGSPALKTDWQTPEWLLERVRALHGDPLPFDAATSSDNPTGALRYCSVEPPQERAQGRLFTQEDVGRLDVTAPGELVGSGLEVPWEDRWWLNPPYGKALKHWLAKLSVEASRELCGTTLLPVNRFETQPMHRLLATEPLACVLGVGGKDGRKAGSRVAFTNPATGDAVEGNSYASWLLGWGWEDEAWAEAFGPIGLCLRLRAVGIGRLW